MSPPARPPTHSPSGETAFQGPTQQAHHTIAPTGASAAPIETFAGGGGVGPLGLVKPSMGVPHGAQAPSGFALSRRCKGHTPAPMERVPFWGQRWMPWLDPRAVCPCRCEIPTSDASTERVLNSADWLATDREDGPFDKLSRQVSIHHNHQT